MDTYTVTRVTKTGKRLTGSPTRSYRAANALGAGALYVAAEGIDGARFAGGDAGRFTFNPPADGAPMHVLVESADENTVTYTVTLTAAQGGRHPHVVRGIKADDVYDAVVAAYREHYGDNVWVSRRDVHSRGSNVGSYSVIGAAGAITFADVEVVAPRPPVEAAAVEDTVSSHEVWRCAGRSGSMYAKRDAFGYVEVFASNLDAERAAGTHLFKITL